MKSIIYFTLLTFFLNGCSSDKECVEVKLKNLTGLDGCGWVLEQVDGTVLEPVNLEDFENSPNENQKVCITYDEVDGGSICMVGKLVKIKTWEE